MSKILAGQPQTSDSNSTGNLQSELQVTVKENSGDKALKCECSCTKKSVKISETRKLGSMIGGLISSHRGGKTTIKLEIEFTD